MEQEIDYVKMIPKTCEVERSLQILVLAVNIGACIDCNAGLFEESAHGSTEQSRVDFVLPGLCHFCD